MVGGFAQLVMAEVIGVGADPTSHFDILGAALSAVGLVLVVMGILAADDNLWLTLSLMVVGALVLVAFFLTVPICAILAYEAVRRSLEGR